MKNELAQLRTDINAALEAVAKKHGLSKLAATSCKYLDSSATFTLEVVKEGGVNKEGEMYKTFYKLHGLPPLNTELDMGTSGIYTMIGMNTTGTKVHGRQKANGKTYLLTTATVALVWTRHLAKQAAATAEK